MLQTDFDHVVIQAEDADEAFEFAEYLTFHHVLAVAEKNEVTCTVRSTVEYGEIRRLKETWAQHWENTPRGLLGLPVYIKPRSKHSEFL